MATNPFHNPLFPSPDEPDDQSDGFVLPSRQDNTIQPLNPDNTKGRDAAANIVRQKLDTLYAEEPSAQAEITEIEHHHQPPSKHQQYLQQLQSEAKSVADIQVKWHEYYTALPEHEKHEVWQEFYAEQGKHSRYAQFSGQQAATQPAEQPQDKPVVRSHTPERTAVTHQDLATESASSKRVRDMRSSREIKQGIRDKVSAGGQLKAKHHFQSLLFGLGSGAVVLLIMLFGLFNEMIVAPFIQPSRNVSSTPIILSSDAIAADEQSKVIIPKINVEIPTDFSLTSLEEDIVQQGLENGVVHYPITSLPGEQGNTVFFGHSSNNIFNPGKYKFAFVLLSKLDDGDMFYLTYEGKVYAYRVFKKQVVNPDETWVLNPVSDKAATAALITCDPPGTTLKRLVVWGEQISPDPVTAVASSAGTQIDQEEVEQPLPGPAKSIWNRFTDWIF